MADAAGQLVDLDDKYLRSLDDARSHLEQAMTAMIRANSTVGIAATVVPSYREPDGDRVVPFHRGLRAPADRWDGRTDLAEDLADTARKLYDLLTIDGRRDP